MAIIFISAKKKQRAIFWSISTLAILMLAIVFLAAFPVDFNGQVKVNPEDVVVPVIEVNFDLLNSDKVKNLEPFQEIKSDTENPGRDEPFFQYY